MIWALKQTIRKTWSSLQVNKREAESSRTKNIKEHIYSIWIDGSGAVPWMKGFHISPQSLEPRPDTDK